MKCQTGKNGTVALLLVGKGVRPELDISLIQKIMAIIAMQQTIYYYLLQLKQGNVISVIVQVNLMVTHKYSSFWASKLEDLNNSLLSTKIDNSSTKIDRTGLGSLGRGVWEGRA